MRPLCGARRRKARWGRPGPVRGTLALLLGWLAIAGPTAAQGSPPPIVRAIEIRSDVEIAQRDDPRPYLAFSVGEPLTPEDVRRTLRNLYFSGLASRIEISTRETEGGVVAVVSLWANVLIDDIRLTGERGSFRRSELWAVIPLRRGEPLVESRVLRGDFQLEDLFQDHGYLSARVRLGVDVDPPRQRAVVTYHVEPGPRAVIGEVRFTGDLGPFTAEELTSQIRGRPGEPYRRSTLEEDADRLRRWLIGQGHRAAEVELADRDLVPERARVDLSFRVQAGPRVVTEVEGAKLAQLDKKGLLPFLEEEGYDEALVLLAAERIKTYYQRQGHYRVQVDTRHEELVDDGVRTLRISIRVDPGPVYSLQELRFEGNRAFDDERLGKLMETSSSRLLGLGGGRLVDQVLADDLANIRSFYALHGYLQARVGPWEVVFDDREISITIPVREGARERVGELRIEGVRSLEQAEVQKRLQLAPGEGFHPLLLEDFLNALRSLYEEEGYSQARVSSTEEWNDDHTVVDLEIQVFEGPRQHLDRIIVTGNTRTQTPVILHALGIQLGDPISSYRLLEMERRLYRLGIFSSAEVELIPADLGSTRRDAVVRVEEGRTRSMTWGLGYDSDDGARGLVGLALHNVFGRAYIFRSDLRIARKDSRFRLFFDQPWIRGWPVAMSYEAVGIEENREGFQATRRLGRVEARRERGPWRYSLFYDYRRIKSDDFAAAFLEQDLPDKPLKPGILSPLELEDGEPRPVWVSTLATGFSLDLRDDPLEPNRGWSASGQLQYAFPLLRAEAEYLELFYQQRHFVALGKLGVLAASLRLAGIEPLFTPPGAEGDPVLAIPIDERLFAGGRTTHRAFPRFGLGIPGETLVVDGNDREATGGNGLVLLNVEYRFPIAEALGGVVFVDSGNVWRDWRDVRVGDLRQGIGVGVRYLSPIGPLRIDGAWKLGRRPGESSFELHFSFGNPF